MSLVLSLLLIGLCITVGVLFALGMASLNAVACLNRGIENIRDGDYAAARKAILRAVRLNPALRKNEELSRLYEIIVSDDKTNAVLLADQMRVNIPNWPKTKLQTFYQSPEFRVLLIMFLVILFVIKLANL